MSEEEAEWVIWSYEHDGWWGPGKVGYTRDLREAGRYSRAEAVEICEAANRYSERVNECMIRLGEL